MPAMYKMYTSESYWFSNVLGIYLQLVYFVYS